MPVSGDELIKAQNLLMCNFLHIEGDVFVDDNTFALLWFTDHWTLTKNLGKSPRVIDIYESSGSPVFATIEEILPSQKLRMERIPVDSSIGFHTLNIWLKVR